MLRLKFQLAEKTKNFPLILCHPTVSNPGEDLFSDSSQGVIDWKKGIKFFGFHLALSHGGNFLGAIGFVFHIANFFGSAEGTLPLRSSKKRVGLQCKWKHHEVIFVFLDTDLEASLKRRGASRLSRHFFLNPIHVGGYSVSNVNPLR